MSDDTDVTAALPADDQPSHPEPQLVDQGVIFQPNARSLPEAPAAPMKILLQDAQRITLDLSLYMPGTDETVIGENGVPRLTPARELWVGVELTFDAGDSPDRFETKGYATAVFRRQITLDVPHGAQSLTLAQVRQDPSDPVSVLLSGITLAF